MITSLVNYSRFGAICELKSAQAVAPQKPWCGATVCVKRKLICVHFDVSKSALNVLLYMKELNVLLYTFVNTVSCIDDVHKQSTELL